jgi:hypothetical protein
MKIFIFTPPSLYPQANSDSCHLDGGLGGPYKKPGLFGEEKNDALVGSRDSTSRSLQVSIGNKYGANDHVR